MEVSIFVQSKQKTNSKRNYFCGGGRTRTRTRLLCCSWKLLQVFLTSINYIILTLCCSFVLSQHSVVSLIKYRKINPQPSVDGQRLVAVTSRLRCRRSWRFEGLPWILWVKLTWPQIQEAQNIICSFWSDIFLACSRRENKTTSAIFFYWQFPKIPP